MKGFWANTVDAGILFAVYFLTARFGLSLDAVSGFAAVVWPPTGIALFALFQFGLRLWPGVFLGAFAANLLAGAPLLAALGIGMGNTLEAVVAVWLLRRFRFQPDFGRVRDVVVFLIGVVFVSTLISSSIGAGSLFATGAIGQSAFWETWYAWGVGDRLSNLILAPFLLVWSTVKIFPLRVSLGRAIEIVLLGLSIGAVLGLLFGTFRQVVTLAGASYFVFIPPVWAALRFGLPGTTLVSLATAVISLLGVFYNYGPFSRESFGANIFGLRIFLEIVSIVALFTAAFIAERRHITQQLALSIKDLEKAKTILEEGDRLKTEFVSLVSHHFRTPLVAIRWGSEHLLGLTYMRPEDKEKINKINTAARGLSGFAEDLLHVSRVEMGQMRVAPGPFEVVGFIRDFLEEWKPVAQQKDIIFAFTCGEKQLFAETDAIGFRSIFQTFLQNALIYTPEQGTVRVFLTKQDASFVCQVQDEGPGISKADQPLIFQKFFRGSNPKDEGSGIGLYLSSKIAAILGGRMWFETEEGKGTSFFVELPLRPKA